MGKIHFPRTLLFLVKAKLLSVSKARSAFLLTIMIGDAYVGGGISIVNLLEEISRDTYLGRKTQVMTRMTKFEVHFLIQTLQNLPCVL